MTGLVGYGEKQATVTARRRSRSLLHSTVSGKDDLPIFLKNSWSVAGIFCILVLVGIPTNLILEML
jgi:hypothetical protein